MSAIEEELKQKKQHVEELNSVIEQLGKENTYLKNSLEKLQSVNDLNFKSCRMHTFDLH